MTDTAKIRAKGLDATGVTEEIARRIADAEAGTLMCVVEIDYAEVHKPKGGDRRVDFVIRTVEPAPNQATEDHLRELTRSFYYERQLISPDGQLTIETREDLEPTVLDVVAAGKALTAHDFTPVPDDPETGAETDECDVCGNERDSAVHDAADQRATIPDPFAATPA